MTITKEFLKKHNICNYFYEWFLECGETESNKVIQKLMAEGLYGWAHWLIVRIMTHDQKIMYDIFLATHFKEKYVYATIASNSYVYVAKVADAALIEYGLSLISENV